jgi:PAS domain S-box-containing protein
MHSAAAFAEYLSDALILLTAASAANAVLRRRDTHRLNILAFVTALALVQAIRRPAHHLLWIVGTGLLLAQPYLLLRLARHFRDVPAVVLRTALAAAVVGMLALTAPPLLRPRVADLVVAAYACVFGLYVYGALAFSRQAGRTAGVTAWRLALAAAGTWAFALVFAIATAFLAGDAVSKAWGQVNQLAHAAALACYFLAFTTPRSLSAMWQRAEQARYLSATADRDPEDRGRRAPSDLLEAAKRSVGHSLILVALRPASDAGPFVVRAATDRSLIGTAIEPTGGVIGRVTATKVAEMAAPADCGPDLAKVVAPLGNGLLVAPIASSTRLWGVVVAVQRRGSLFPEDDLVLLGQLGRYAATALDHAALVAEARDRERRRADVRLHAAEARMRLMLDSIKDYAMFVLDADGLVVTWHVGAEQVFDYTADEMTGDQAAPLFNLLPAQFQARLEEARQVGRSVWEGPCRRKNGDRFVGSTVIRPLAGEADLAGFAAVTRDVTEQRDLEERLRQGQKMEAIGQLAGGIAHDFNNMLLAILGYADLLAEDAKGDAGRLELIVEIQRAAERAAGLTRRLLAFGRRQLLQPSAVSLSTLVTELLPMLRRVIAEHIEIVTETAPDTRPVLGDRGQLEQVVVNLAVNARDAMPEGGQLTIRTSAEWLDEANAGGEVPAGAYALLEVTDTGMGMDAATRERIFEPFFTTKGFGYGTGLGLATVYGIVKQMGGLIRVTSDQGRGTRFQIYLPETHQRAVSPAPAAPFTPPRGHETLLLVEDDGAVRMFLVRTLERHGYRVLSAEHPAAALAIVQAHTDPIHLVVTDVVLPGLVGPEFVRALADLRADKPPLPVLYISGYADGSLVWRGQVPKDSHFLQKPFSAGELLTRIRQILPPTGAAGDHAV